MMSKRQTFLAGVLSAFAVTWLALPIRAVAHHNTLRLVVPYPATGSTDQALSLSKEISEIMKLPAVQQRSVALGAEPVSATQAQSKATIDAFKAQWEPLSQKSGITLG